MVNKFWNEKKKALTAGAIGVALLSGGFGTFALWSWQDTYVHAGPVATIRSSVVNKAIMEDLEFDGLSARAGKNEVSAVKTGDLVYANYLVAGFFQGDTVPHTQYKLTTPEIAVGDTVDFGNGHTAVIDSITFGPRYDKITGMPSNSGLANGNYVFATFEGKNLDAIVSVGYSVLGEPLDDARDVVISDLHLPDFTAQAEEVL